MLSTAQAKNDDDFTAVRSSDNVLDLTSAASSQPDVAPYRRSRPQIPAFPANPETSRDVPRLNLVGGPR